MSDRPDRTNKTIEITYRDDVGETDGRSFAKWMGIGATAMTLLLVTVLSVGMLSAALGVGIGGFIASFGEVNAELDGDDGALYPVLGEQPACDEAPQLMAYFPGTAEVDQHVAFYKDLPLPDTFNVDVARINIVSDDPQDLELEDLDLRLSALNASALILDASNSVDPDADVEISEFSDFGDETGDAYDSYGVDGGEVQTLAGDELADNVEFGISIPEGSNVTIDDGLAAAHHVAFSSATLNNLDIFITMGDDGDFEAEGTPAQRHVDPADRTCDALATASSPDLYDSYP